MKNTIIGVVLSCIIVLSLAVSACTPETTPTPTTAKPTATPTATTTAPANWWDKFGEPQYGGTITRRTTSGALSSISLDPTKPPSGGGPWNEKLFMPDWAVDRDIFPFTTGWTPQEYCGGLLAESWEQTDPQTLVVNIRQGVHWQNKPPLNGREFTAEDVQYNYDRILGTGSGFTEPNPFFAGDLATVERAVATGPYTVEFKFKEPTVLGLDTVFTNSRVGLTARELMEQADLDNWQEAVGTGPWILTDYVANTSVTYSRNPDYWGHDERYPENQLPYADELRSVAIDDMTTAVAAMRTGQIDMLVEYNGPSLQQVQSLAQTDPEIQQALWPRDGLTLALRCDHEPFTDIRVRKALQLAIDCKTIAQSYYLGAVDGTPVGFIHPIFKDWSNPYDQWPADLQAEYSFNPEKAKELLAEANLAGGFTTSCATASVFDLELLQIVKSYLMDIGVDMSIETYDMPVYDSLVRAGEVDQIAVTTQTGRTIGPIPSFQSRTTGHWQNYTYNNDPTYDAMYNEMMAASSLDEVKRLAKEMDLYILRQHWTVNTVPMVNPVIWQPWVQGYSGEFTEINLGTYYARFWIDPSMK